MFTLNPSCSFSLSVEKEAHKGKGTANIPDSRCVSVPVPRPRQPHFSSPSVLASVPAGGLSWPQAALRPALYLSPFSTLPTARQKEQRYPRKPARPHLEALQDNLPTHPPGHFPSHTPNNPQSHRMRRFWEPVTTINTVLRVGNLRKIRQWVKAKCMLPHIL